MNQRAGPKKPQLSREEGITRISVSGFKSLSQEQSIGIHPLTILAGANSSGKSRRYFQVSAPAVHQMVVMLEKRGFIERRPGQARSIFLTRVVLRNYKSIAACDVRLHLLVFLVGPNGAGESNFLDALDKE
ncbi:MAG: hypothetical protein HY268_13535 [Deltaproteobacteria bacterium]|nr:hypothetical protein [Deltaproteobacteria bacterium]